MVHSSILISSNRWDDYFEIRLETEEVFKFDKSESKGRKASAALKITKIQNQVQENNLFIYIFEEMKNA